MSGRGRGRGRGRAQAAREPTIEERAATVTAEWMGRDHRNPMWVDPVFLDESGFRNELTAMFRRSGWSRALTLIHEADKNDTSEFIASLEYEGPQEHEGFTYRHRGVVYRCTMRRLREVFGWAMYDEHGGRYFPPYANWGPAWAAVSRALFNGGNNAAASLTEPIMFYVHHFLCKTIFAKKCADKIGQEELGVLQLLRAGTVVHWGHYFIKHVVNLQTRSPIMVGGMITYLLRTLHPDFPVPEAHTILRPYYMDRVWFQNGQSIQVTHDGGVQWCYFRDPALRPPPVPRRPRGRPPAEAAGQAIVIQDPDQQGRPRHSYERGESSSQQQHYQPESSGGFQEQLYRAQTDAFFNATRASLMPGVDLAYVPAPPGWRAGDPIPQEFMTPFPPAGGY